jgi:glucose-6-phosphate 1-dehydrogenase
VFGQYDKGEIDGQKLPGYLDEPGVKPDSRTETFIALKMSIDHPIFRDVPIFIRTGKRMCEKTTQIILEFRSPHENPLAKPNLVTLTIAPTESLSIEIHDGDQLLFLSSAFSPSNESYENILHDAITGDNRFFAHWSEIECAWKLVAPLLQALQNPSTIIHPYRTGSNGPFASNQMLAKYGFYWIFD